MAGMIKNQIIKHLSKFTKNLSVDKIHLSTLKGEGDLSNLELNEEALMELLELPSWIRLSKAVCNKVRVKIQWTKLKTHPILLYLDEVLVEMETCEELRQPYAQLHMPSYSSGGKYGFSDRVIDGMMVCVNSVIVNFRSKTFRASIQISRMQVQSLTPQWKTADLRRTRIKDPDRGELLIFKELEWQNLRIEANALETTDGLCNAAPLRLITNQSKCRITVKKKLIDCSVVTSRLHLLLDELLWVLTDTQLKAAMTFMASLSDLIQKADEVSKTVKAAKKLEAFPEYKQWLQQQAKGVYKNETSSNNLFNMFDIVETSYHVHFGKVELQLCDDFNPNETSKCHYNSAIEGGAMQITLYKLSLDYYPYHLTSAHRKKWLHYKGDDSSRDSWIEDLLNTFQKKLQAVLKEAKTEEDTNTSAKIHSPKSSKNLKSNQFNAKAVSITQTMMSSCCVVRLDNFVLYQVSTVNIKWGGSRKFFSSDKGHLHLPKDMPAIYAEYTEYYYPDSSNYPVPAPNVFVLINPVKLVLDNLTVLWLNSFILNLQQSLAVSRTDDKPHVDVRLEALMPRILFIPEKSYFDHPDRPKAVQLQASNVIITNCWTSQDNSIPILLHLLHKLENATLFSSETFPTQQDDIQLNLSFFQSFVKRFAQKTDSPIKTRTPFSKDLFWTYAKDDVWNLETKQIWADFIDTESRKNRPLSFIDAFPISLWVHQQLFSNSSESASQIQNNICTFNNNSGLENNSSSKNDLKIQIILNIESKIRAQIHHLQYLVLLRLLDSINQLQLQFYKDSAAIRGYKDMSSFLCTTVLSEFELFLIFPPIPYCDNPDHKAENSGIMSGHNNEPLLKSPVEDHISDSPNKTCDYTVVNEDPLNNNLQVPPLSNNLMKSQSDSALPISVIQDFSSEATHESSLSLSKRKCTEHKRLQSTDSLCPELSPKKKTLEGRPSSKNELLFNFKKSFSNVRNTLDSAFSKDSDLFSGHKQVTPSSDSKWCDDPSALPDSETVSLYSDDVSSDDDAFILLNADSMSDVGSVSGFPLDAVTPVELASEVHEDVYNETNLNLLTDVYKKEEMVSLVVFHFYNVELIQQSIGLDSVLKIQCKNLEIDEQGNMSWDSVQNNFVRKNENKNTSLPECNFPIKLRMSQGPAAESLSSSAAERGFIHLLVENVKQNLKMSTLVNITDFMEDEIVPLPVPMHIDINDFNLHFEEDRPATNESSPGPIPLDLHIPSALISRSSDGIFHVMPRKLDCLPKHKLLTTARGHQENFNGFDALAELEYIKAENSRLTTVLNSMKNLAIENEELKSKLKNFHLMEDENIALLTQLASCKDDIECREKEKSSLMATLQLLQDELLKSEEMRAIKKN